MTVIFNSFIFNSDPSGRPPLDEGPSKSDENKARTCTIERSATRAGFSMINGLWFCVFFEQASGNEDFIIDPDVGDHRHRGTMRRRPITKARNARSILGADKGR